MSLQSVKNSIKFWDGINSVWSPGIYGAPAYVYPIEKFMVYSWIDQIYVSPFGEGLLERAAQSGKFRIAADVAVATAYVGAPDPWIGLNFASVANLYWFNAQGEYVRGDSDLVLAHELSHLIDGTMDPNNSQPPTDEMQNAGTWDFTGATVRAQNQIAIETQRVEQIRATYGATVFSTADTRHQELVQGVSYTDGYTVQIVRLGEMFTNNQDHTARLDNSSDLILGLGGADYIHGGGGDDHLYGGDGADQIYGGTGDDRLFGEAGDDRLVGNVGVDLLHGGFNLAVNPLADHEADGDDEAHYGVFLTSISGLGIEIGLTETVWSNRFASLPDFGRAIFVRDLARDGAVDTLISIERIIGTDSDDRFVISSFDQMRIAGADGTGGLRSVDLGDHVETSSQGGDLLDFSGCDVGVLVDFSVPEGFVCSISDETNTKIFVKGVERVIGSQFADVIKGKGNGLLEGGDGDDVLHGFAGDILIGGAGADEFHLRTDRLTPAGEGSGSHSPYDNTILILGFDFDDALYIDGVRYTGYQEHGTLEESYFSDEVNAMIYHYDETRSGSHWNGVGQEFIFGTTDYFSFSDLSSNAGIALSGRFELTLYGPNGEGLRVLIAGFDPTEGGINFVTARDYVDPPDYGLYKQHVGYSNGYNIFNPAVIPHNPDATYEQLNVGVFDFYDDWASRLPAGMVNYASYLDLLGSGGAEINALGGGGEYETVAFASVESASLLSAPDMDRTFQSAIWQNSGTHQNREGFPVFEADGAPDPSSFGEKSLGNGSTALLRRGRPSMLQHEVRGGPARVTSDPLKLGEASEVTLPLSHVLRTGEDLATMLAQPNAYDAAPDHEIVRKLAMIRQDMNSFGVTGVGEIDQLRRHEPDSLYLHT